MSQPNRQAQPQQQDPVTYDQIYQRFNTTELAARQSFEMVYNKCQELEKINQTLQTQVSQLMTEKEQWSKVKPPGDNNKSKIVQKVKN